MTIVLLSERKNHEERNVHVRVGLTVFRICKSYTFYRSRHLPSTFLLLVWCPAMTTGIACCAYTALLSFYAIVRWLLLDFLTGRSFLPISLSLHVDNLALRVAFEIDFFLLSHLANALERTPFL